MNKIQEVVQKLRSGSESSDKSSSVSTLSGDEPYQKVPGSGRDAVWVTDASHPISAPPYHVGVPSFVSYLNELPMSSTAIPQHCATPKTDDDSLISAGSNPTPISAQAMQQTVYQSLMESSGSSGVSSLSWSSFSHPPLERKSSKPKQQPKGTLEYTVQDGDTLDRIGAHHDVTPSELIKINKLLSRTVFEGQILFIPDPDYVPSDPPSPKAPSSPTGADTRPKVDLPLATLGDRSPPTVPGHVVQVATSPVFKPSPPSRQQSENEGSDLDKECQQKFVKIRSRRVLEQEENNEASFGGVTCRGTLLVTPNAIMFDPDVNDPFVIQNEGQTKFSTVVYMENVKSVALYPDMSPRIFWKQPKEIRSRSPRPEPYKPDSAPTLSEDGSIGETRQAPDGICTTEDSSLHRRSPEGGNEVTESGKDNDSMTRQRRMSDELEDMNELSQNLPVSPPQPGRASEEVEHMLTFSGDINSHSSQLQQQMSRSSELAGSEIALLDEMSKEIGATRDFGPHMGRSSSEMSRQGLPGSLNRIYISSPRESINSGLSMDRSDSTNDNLNTPTQGFAPVFFTDRSPNSAIAAPKPVSGQKSALHLSELGSLSEDTPLGEKRLSGDGNSSTECQPSPMGGHKTVSGNSEDVETNKGITESYNMPNNNMKAKSESASTGGQTEEDILRTETTSEKVPEGQSGSDKVSDDSHISSTANEEANFKQEFLSDSTDGRIPPGSTIDGSTKSSISSPLSSSFSPLRTPAQHISSFFNYTTGFFRGSDKDKSGIGTPGATSTPAAEDSALNKISKNLPTFQFPSSLIPGAFSTSSSSPTSSTSAATVPTQQTISSTDVTSSSSSLQTSSDGKQKENMSQVLGPPPSAYLPRSDSPQFVVSPMYLQIRTGVPNNQDPEIPKRHAIVRRISGKLMEEYWFVIPRDMTNRLYKFLIEWQPDAYGDQEDCKGRERYFYDPREVGHLIQSRVSGSLLPFNEDYYAANNGWEIVGTELTERLRNVTDAPEEVRPSGVEEMVLPELINGASTILTQEHLKKVMTAIPRNMSVGYDWSLIFSTNAHGFSLRQLYREMRERDNGCPVVLWILDTDHNIFGAYLSNTIRVSEGFYGSGSTFLFTFYPEFKHYHWQGDNSYFMNGTPDCFAIGSGEGIFGLWLDGDLDKGSSHMCTTFDNDILTTKEDFHIVNLEVWQLSE